MRSFLLGCVLKERRRGGYEPAIQGGEGADGICAIGVDVSKLLLIRPGKEEAKSLGRMILRWECMLEEGCSLMCFFG